MIPIKINKNKNITLNSSKSSQLIKGIIEEFVPHFLVDSMLLFISNKNNKWSYFDEITFEKIGLVVGELDKMPDVIFYNPSKKLLVLIELVTSHGPIDSKRQFELDKLFSTNLKKIYFSVFPSKQSFSKYSQDIAWETNVWIADNATHMIHFNGDKFIG